MKFSFEGVSYEADAPKIIHLAPRTELPADYHSSVRGAWGDGVERQRSAPKSRLIPRALVVLGGKVSLAEGDDVAKAEHAVRNALNNIETERQREKKAAAGQSLAAALDAAFPGPAGAGLISRDGRLRWRRANGNSQGVGEVKEGVLVLCRSSDRREAEDALRAAGFTWEG